MAKTFRACVNLWRGLAGLLFLLLSLSGCDKSQSKPNQTLVGEPMELLTTQPASKNEPEQQPASWTKGIMIAPTTQPEQRQHLPPSGVPAPPQ